MHDAAIPDDAGADDGLATRLMNLSERTPSDVERQVMGLSAGSSLDELCAALDATEWLLARARTIDRLMKQIAIGWIDRNGEFAIGDVRYSVGFSLAFRCLNVPQTGHAVLEAAGGDFNHFMSVLVAQPFRHAAVRDIIGNRLHGCLFRAHRTGRLVNGVPERILKHADARFRPQPRGR